MVIELHPDVKINAIFHELRAQLVTRYQYTGLDSVLVFREGIGVSPQIIDVKIQLASGKIVNPHGVLDDETLRPGSTESSPVACEREQGEHEWEMSYWVRKWKEAVANNQTRTSFGLWVRDLPAKTNHSS